MKNAALLLALLSLPLQADEQLPEIAFNAGVFEAFDSKHATEIGLEYRARPLAALFELKPAVGVTANADGGYWAHAGLRYDYFLSPSWVLTPGLSVVAYEDGAGRDLGSGFLFRSGLEIAYKPDRFRRIGLGIYHMSNADLAKNNPGSESVFLSYSFTPISWR